MPILATLAITLLLAADPAAPPAKHHTVFQMSEAESEWEPLIAHVQNLKKALDPDGGVEVEVVFFGPGIQMLKAAGNKYADALKHLSDQGVKLAACQNSMRARNLKTEDLFPFAIQVDSGVAELTRKQEAHWAYIK